MRNEHPINPDSIQSKFTLDELLEEGVVVYRSVKERIYLLLEEENGNRYLSWYYGAINEGFELINFQSSVDLKVSGVQTINGKSLNEVRKIAEDWVDEARNHEIRPEWFEWIKKINLYVDEARKEYRRGY